MMSCCMSDHANLEDLIMHEMYKGTKRVLSTCIKLFLLQGILPQSSLHGPDMQTMASYTCICYNVSLCVWECIHPSAHSKINYKYHKNGHHNN